MAKEMSPLSMELELTPSTIAPESSDRVESEGIPATAESDDAKVVVDSSSIVIVPEDISVSAQSTEQDSIVMVDERMSSSSSMDIFEDSIVMVESIDDMMSSVEEDAESEKRIIHRNLRKMDDE